MRRFVVVVLFAAFLVPWFAVQAQNQRTDNVSEFMQAKLKHAQNVLEGLAMEDFDQIAKILHISERTAARYWAYGRVWLLRRITGSDGVATQ